MPTRNYRRRLVQEGQSSPPYLCEWVVQTISNIEKSSLSIIDIGCGLGHQMARIKNQLDNCFQWVEGIDWSPATYEYHQNNAASPYDKVKLCSSEKLPYDDQSFDIALSMENMEHLYGLKSIEAIQEMARIAKYILITTPHPSHVINKAWLSREMPEARQDDEPLNDRDYRCLESAVHKSVLFPSSMLEAGFTYWDGGRGEKHGYYFANSNKIDSSKIRAIGIDEQVQDSKEKDFRKHYVNLLQNSFQLDVAIKALPF